MKRRLGIAASLALLCQAQTGCALLSKAEPLKLRYFEIVQKQTPATSSGGGPRLRLGSVVAASHLDRRIVTRRTAHELGYYEQLRWTEPPEEYVRRALLQDLYGRAGFTRVVSGPAPTLEVELTAFEEVDSRGVHRARVILLALLHDERTQLMQDAVHIETKIANAQREEAEALVSALGEALALASRRVTERAREVLAAARSPAARICASPAPP